MTGSVLLLLLAPGSLLLAGSSIASGFPSSYDAWPLRIIKIPFITLNCKIIMFFKLFNCRGVVCDALYLHESFVGLINSSKPKPKNNKIKSQKTNTSKHAHELSLNYMCTF